MGAPFPAACSSGPDPVSGIARSRTASAIPAAPACTEERGAIAEIVDDEAGGETAERRADALHGRNRTQRQIVPARAAHEVRDHERRQGTEDPGAYAIQELDGNQPHAVVGQSVEDSAYRQDREADEEDLPAPPSIGPAASKQRDRQHHQLRRDDAERHHRRGELLVGQGELLPDQGQQRRIGKMKQHGAGREDDQRPAGHDRLPARSFSACSVRTGAARAPMIDGVSRNRPDRAGREHGKKRHQQEHRALAEEPADAAGHDRDGDVAGVIERGVAAHPGRQLMVREQPQRQRRDRRPEDIADDRQDRIGHEHGPESRHREDDDGPQRQHGERQHDDAAFGPGRVDRGAGRRLRGEAGEAADRRHEADRGLAPTLVDDQENVEIRPERTAHVGEEEVDRVERDRPESSAARSRRGVDDHRRDHRGEGGGCAEGRGRDEPPLRGGQSSRTDVSSVPPRGDDQRSCEQPRGHEVGSEIDPRQRAPGSRRQHARRSE